MKTVFQQNERKWIEKKEKQVLRHENGSKNCFRFFFAFGEVPFPPQVLLKDVLALKLSSESSLSFSFSFFLFSFCFL